MRSMVSDKWQLIAHETMGDQLYDWTLDPAESDKLAPTGQGGRTASEVELETHEAGRIERLVTHKPTSGQALVCPVDEAARKSPNSDSTEA